MDKISIIDRLKNNKFLKNIMTMASGTVIGYGINTLALLIIGRVYTKADLGGYDLIISSASIFMTIVMLALTLVILIPEEDHDANGICKIILLSNVVGITVLTAVLWGIADWYKLFETNVEYHKGLLLFALYMITYNLQAVYFSYSNRKGKYKVLFWNPIVLAVVNGGVSIVLGLLGLQTVGYLIGTISANCVTIGFMSLFVSPFKGKHRLRELWELLKAYKQYPLVQLPANFVEYLALQLPIQYLGRVYSVELLGGYSMACKLLSMPVTLLATPINTVYYKTLIEKVNNKDDIKEYGVNMLKANFFFILIPVGILMVFGEWIAGFVLGDEWRVSGYYIAIVGFSYIIKYCTSCLGGTFVAMKKTHISMKYATGTLIQYAACFGLSYMLKWSYITVMIVFTVNVVVNGMACVELCMRCLGTEKYKVVKLLTLYMTISAVVIYGLYAIVHGGVL